MPQLSGTTSAAYVLTLLDVAEGQGARREALLAAAALDPASLADPMARIAIPALARLFDAAAAQTGNPHIGLAFGAAVRPASYSGLGYVTMTCATLRDALQLIPRFGRLVFDTGSAPAEIGESAGQARLGEAALPADEPSCVGLDDAVLAGWVSFGRWISGRDEAPLRVDFRHAAPADLAPYQALFRCTLAFGQPANCLHFPSHFLDLPVRDADPHLHRAMLREAEAQLERSFAGLSLPQQLRMLLAELLPAGEASLDTAARRLQLAPRTLQRRLAAEGSSFKAVLDTLRREQALRYLCESELSLADIALLLGFAEQSAFSHAFRDWQGCSPLEYRRRPPC